MFSCIKTIDSNETPERTFAIIKSDIITMKKVGEIISLLEKDFSIVALKTFQFDDDKIAKLYRNAEGYHFYRSLCDYLSAGFHIALVLEGENVVAKVRNMKSTIRQQYAYNDCISSFHCSDNIEVARQEIAKFFKKEEIYKKTPSTAFYQEIGNRPEATNKSRIDKLNHL